MLRGLAHWSSWFLITPPALATASAHPAGLADIGTFFFGVGALTMVAFIQERVVNQFHWLTPQEFIDGLALGQFMPLSSARSILINSLPTSFAEV